MTGRKKIAIIPVSNLRPGMIAAKDIYTRNDQLLVATGAKIDEGGIARIMFFGILSVPILVDAEETIAGTDVELDEEAHDNDKMFKKFNEKYQENLVTVTHTMNQLLEVGVEVDEEKLVEDVEKTIAVTNSHYQVFDMISYLKEFDDETYMHSVNVSMICNVFADWLEMSEYEKKHLTVCGLLHDFGKLLVNREILKKPGKLTASEFKIIKEHPTRGYEFLKDKNIHESAKHAVLLHHERCDGKGYPFGMRVSEIDPYAAVTAIADVYEAMTSNRVYRSALCPFDVIRLFEDEGRQQFNPIFLVPILKKLTETYLQHNVVLNDGTVGRVVLINYNELSRPSILSNDKIIDLSKERERKIVQVL